LAAGQSPLAQFEIKRLVPIEIGDFDVSFTNSSAFMVLTVIAISAFLILGMRKNDLVPGRWQSMAELLYIFIANLLKETVGKEGRPYLGWSLTALLLLVI
jgi:F-type H+-transporting ATPase subunit a